MRRQRAPIRRRYFAVCRRTRRGAVHGVPALSVGRDVGPRAPAVLAGLDDREIQRLAGGGRKLHDEAERVVERVRQRPAPPFDGGDALADRRAVLAFERRLDRLRVDIDRPAGLHLRLDGRHAVRNRDAQRDGRGAVAAVRHLQRRFEIGARGAFVRLRGDVGVRAGGQRHAARETDEHGATAPMPVEKVVHVGFLLDGTCAARERRRYLGNQKTVGGGPLGGASEKRARAISGVTGYAISRASGADGIQAVYPGPVSGGWWASRLQ